ARRAHAADRSRGPRSAGLLELAPGQRARRPHLSDPARCAGSANGTHARRDAGADPPALVGLPHLHRRGAVVPDVSYALFGGVYNNWLALEATLQDARARGCAERYCLGDLGGFGPHPDRVFPILRAHDLTLLQGNYYHSIGHDLADCGCGYTDPRDNEWARVSYA